MKCKELCMDLITEYVISTKRIFGGESENVMLYGMIIGLLIGLEEYEDVTALKVLRNGRYCYKTYYMKIPMD